MASKHLDKLTRSFLQTSSPNLGWSDTGGAFGNIQDPTYISFRLNFFPDMGIGSLNDTYSAAGLFRGSVGTTETSAQYLDSAANYLRRIGSPTRQAYHRSFTSMLYKIQEEAPWYFQTVTGLADIYKIDPAINFRGKDKILTIDCLESVDMRMTFLADLYRNFAFDVENMREILPVNLRTFNMEIDVMEFRTFNTTFGIIADALNPSRSAIGAKNQQDILDASVARKQVFQKTSLASGLFDNLVGVGGQVSTILGGLGGIFSGGDVDDLGSLESAFEAISVQKFVLSDCEFDFYTEAPGYLETLSVKDIPEATTKFKIKVGKITKVTTYPFYNFILGEYIRDTVYSKADQSLLITPGNTTADYASGKPYIEEPNSNSNDTTISLSQDNFRNIRDFSQPTSGKTAKKAQSDSYKETKAESDYLRRKPLERLLGGLINNGVAQANNAINNALGNLTGGVIGRQPLGNIYDKPAIIASIKTGIADFFTPGDQSTNNSSMTISTQTKLGKILPDAPVLPDFVATDILPTPPPQPPFTGGNVFNP